MTMDIHVDPPRHDTSGNGYLGKICYRAIIAGDCPLSHVYEHEPITSDEEAQLAWIKGQIEFVTKLEPAIDPAHHAERYTPANLAPPRTEDFITEDGRKARRYLDDSPEEGIAAGSEIYLDSTIWGEPVTQEED